MSDNEALVGAVAVTVVALAFVVRSILSYKGKFDAVAKFDHYLPFAVMAAKWVETQVPDNFGAGTDDPKTARAAHKLDMFLKKFMETVEKQTGDKPTEELKKEAMRWSVELAERMKGKK